MELGAFEAVKYADSILAAIQRERLLEETERGMMRYYCFANGLVAGVALVGFSVLHAQQIAVDGDLRVAETDVKYLVGNLEIVFVGISFGPLLKLHIAPPVYSSTH